MIREIFRNVTCFNICKCFGVLHLVYRWGLHVIFYQRLGQCFFYCIGYSMYHGPVISSESKLISRKQVPSSIIPCNIFNKNFPSSFDEIVNRDIDLCNKTLLCGSPGFAAIYLNLIDIFIKFEIFTISFLGSCFNNSSVAISNPRDFLGWIFPLSSYWTS